ncbi:MAG: competence protein ComEC [Actinomycetota bacterium]|nr:competence protein ComEC [Actinomycetota bacterium]
MMAPATLRAWVAAAGLIVGTVLGWRDASAVVAAVTLCLSLPLFALRRSPRVRAGAMLVGCCSLGILNVQARDTSDAPLTVLARTVPRCQADLVVVEAVAGEGALVQVEHLDCSGRVLANPGRAYLDENPGPPGSRTTGSFRLSPLSSYSSFDIDRARLGAQARVQSLDVTTAPPDAIVMRVAEAARRSLRSATSRWERGGALVMGLTIGETGAIGEDMLQAFRRAGLSHLVAVSGSNLAIVLGAAAFALQGLGHRTRVVGAAGVIGMFVLVVGPQPSVLRAAGMGAVVVAATGWGRRTEPLLALALGLLVVVAWRPSLVHSVGLQLSAAATAGIVLWTAPLTARFHRLPGPLALALAATLAAQLAVAPLLIGTFGELSLIAPLANVLAFPAVAPATVLGVAAGAIGVVLPSLGSLVGGVAALAAEWILVVAARLGSLSWASIDVPGWTGLLAAAPVLWAAKVALVSPADPTQPSRTLRDVSDHQWVLQDADGKELRATETWPTQAEAEAWMGTAWQELADEGAAFVVLRAGSETVYRMSLAEA